ncbi:flagellar biosynthetic protein FliR [Ramlibacter sp. AN1015]|uniref:flagellar biosynthetic protein FliR n=1 Tax=Ramlibacter sp. AN1015 TaxID=3133428 RepID=UPI0030BCE96D
MAAAVFETAGEIIGLQMGLSFAGFFNPQGGSQSAVSSWLNVLAMLLFVSINAHLLLIEALVATFESLPIAADLLAALSRLRLEQLGADVFRLALTLALPATMLMLFVNVVLGFASRMAPQMSIFAVGFPITLLAGMLVLLLGIDHLPGVMHEGLERFIGAVR